MKFQEAKAALPDYLKNAEVIRERNLRKNDEGQDSCDHGYRCRLRQFAPVKTGLDSKHGDRKKIANGADLQVDRDAEANPEQHHVDQTFSRRSNQTCRDAQKKKRIRSRPKHERA